MHTRIGELILKQIEREITRQELIELEQFAARSAENRQLVADLTNPDYLVAQIKSSYDWKTSKALKKIQKAYQVNVPKRWMISRLFIWRKIKRWLAKTRTLS